MHSEDPHLQRLFYGADPNQFLDLRPTAATAGDPLLVMIHGGFWRSRFDLSHSAAFCQALTRSGFATANIEYRRVGQPGGGWPGTLADVTAAVRFALHRCGDAIVMLGHSAGGHLALWLAGEMPELAGVVGLAPVASLRLCWERHLSNDAVCDFLGGKPHQVPDRYLAADPENRPSAVPRVLIHGAADDVVPVELSHAYALARAADENPPRVLELPGVDHSAVIDPASPAWNSLRELLHSFQS